MIKLKDLLGEFGGTMNAQEMKRHIKKLAKLKKVLDKQGDKMEPYPTNLPNTVFGVKMLTGPNPLKIKKK